MKKLVFTWSPPSDTCDWQRLDANGNREGVATRYAPLSALREAAPGHELIWLAPGVELLAVTATLPVKGRDKMLRALPYALEDQFAGEPEKLFFALPPETGDGPTQAITADAGWLRSALERLSAEGLDPVRVLPDYLALPRAEDSWTVLADAGMLYVRTGAANGFSFETGTGWAVLMRRLDDLAEEDRPHFLRYLRGRDPRGAEPAIATVEGGLQADPEPVGEGLLAVLPEAFTQPSPINLLQGPFKRGSDWQKALKPWRPAAWALAAVVLLAIVGFAASWIQDAHADKLVGRQLRERFHQLMPSQPWQGNYTARRLIERRLSGAANAGNEHDLLPLLAALAAANPDTVRIESLDFHGGTLQIRLHAANVTQLETLRSTLATESRLAVTIRSANQTDSGVEGALTIGAGARS